MDKIKDDEYHEGGIRFSSTKLENIWILVANINSIIIIITSIA